MELDHLVGVFHVLISHLRDVDQSVLMDADVDERAEVGDVGHDARQLHALLQVVDGLNALCKLKLLNLLARVASGLLELLQNVGERGQSHFAGDVALQVDGLATVLVVDKVGDCAPLVGSHLLDYLVALGVDGRVVERVLGSGNAQESGTLLEGCRPQSRHLLELGAAGEGSVLATVVDDVASQRGTQSADVLQQVGGGGIEVDAYGVDAAHHRLVELLLELGLVDVVLVLAYADALRVNLHQFSQRVHQPAPYRDGSAHGDILVGELLARRL